MSVAPRALLLPLCLGFLAAPAMLPAQKSSTLSLHDGTVIEVIGLRRWTVGMLQDSLAKYAPHDSLQSHACAVTLRYTLHFADAASAGVSFSGRPDRIVVSVREPQDSARVHFRNLPLDSLSPRARWEPVTSVLRSRPDLFWSELQWRLHASRAQRPSYRTRDDSAAAARFAATLGSLTRERDRLEAMRALAEGRNMYDRAAAAVILSNFAERDDSWWALLEAMRETDGPVKGIAATILVRLSEARPRVVRWAPRARAIHAMLDGTSLFVLDDLMQVLLRTGVRPADARAMLGNGGGDMLLAYLASGTEVYASHSRALLGALRGKDLGPDAEPWRAWMATL